jgi:pimeloyl-ACP methyl ester carboxylesterase
MIGLLALLLLALVIVLVTLAAVGAHAAWKPPRRAAGWALAHRKPISPTELGLACTEWFLDRDGGTRLCVWDLPGHAPKGPAIVLLHGWSRSKLTWLEFLELWCSRGRRIIVVDLRGHGDSTPDGVTFGDQDAQDIAAIVEKIDEPATVLVGRSLGGVVAMKAAAITPKISGVVAVAPYIRLRDTIHARVQQRGLPTVGVVPLAMLFMHFLGVRSASTLLAVRQFKCPLLIIHGTSDPISPLADAHRLAEEAVAATLIEVQGAGHGDHWELER